MSFVCIRFVHNEKVNKKILLICSFHLYDIIYVHNEKVDRNISLI